MLLIVNSLVFLKPAHVIETDRILNVPQINNLTTVQKLRFLNCIKQQHEKILNHLLSQGVDHMAKAFSANISRLTREN